MSDIMNILLSLLIDLLQLFIHLLFLFIDQLIRFFFLIVLFIILCIWFLLKTTTKDLLAQAFLLTLLLIFTLLILFLLVILTAITIFLLMKFLVYHLHQLLELRCYMLGLIESFIFSNLLINDVAVYKAVLCDRIK